VKAFFYAKSLGWRGKNFYFISYADYNALKEFVLNHWKNSSYYFQENA
jgi:hypothetical protein